jgi:hypothetical protein
MGGKDTWQGGQVNDSNIKVNLANNLNNYRVPVAWYKTEILDNECTSHYLKWGSYCTNMQWAHMPIHIKLPDGQKLASTATADLAIHNFNHRARSAHIINGLATHYLLSCGKICDAGYRVLFDEGKAKIFEGDVTVHGKVLMKGQRNTSTWLWTVPLDNKNQEWGNKYKNKRDEITSNIYDINKVHEAIQYLNAAAGSPVPSTFSKAIEAWDFVTWPTSTAQYVRKYLEKSEAKIKGHLNQKRKNARSTRPKKRVTAPNEEV